MIFLEQGKQTAKEQVKNKTSSSFRMPIPKYNNIYSTIST